MILCLNYDIPISFLLRETDRQTDRHKERQTQTHAASERARERDGGGGGGGGYRNSAKLKAFTTCFLSNTDLCDGCEFKHGVGYNPHPSDCTLFVQCRLGNHGYPVVAGVQACPHGLYWNQHKLTCDHRRNVNCVDGKS